MPSPGRAFVACAALLAVAPAAASDRAPPALHPFTAHYSVLLGDREQGRSSIRLEHGTGGTWRYTLTAEGTRGMARLAGIETEQTSVFVLDQGRPRLQHALERRDALLSGREVETVFDWVLGEARWSGDVKPDRRGPVALTSNAVNAQLLNLSLALDARGHAPGDTLRYRLLDRGSADVVAYTVAPSVTLDTALGPLRAIPLVHEAPGKRRSTTVWFAPGLPPTPVRVLRVQDGKPAYELRLLRIEQPAAGSAAQGEPPATR